MLHALLSYVVAKFLGVYVPYKLCVQILISGFMYRARAPPAPDHRSTLDLTARTRRVQLYLLAVSGKAVVCLNFLWLLCCAQHF